MPLRLEVPVQYVKGVGPARAAMLQKVQIATVEDLLNYKPFRYEDRSSFRLMNQLRVGEDALVEGEIAVCGNYSTPMKKVRIFEMVVEDRSGALAVKFFNQPYLQHVLRNGQRLILYGQVRRDDYTLRPVLLNPEWELVVSSSDSAIHSGRIVPIYRRVGKLTARSMRTIVHRAVTGLQREVQDPIPDRLLEKHGLPDRRRAWRELHFPVRPEDRKREAFLADLESSATPAQRRFVFEEFFLFHLGLQVVRRDRESLPKTRRIEINDGVREVVKGILPFHPTSAQKRVVGEIVDDLRSGNVMRRLLHGDVGSGKTIVALQAMVVVLENGFQAALMAPTEILAEQHFRTLSRYLRDTGYRLALLTGRVRGKRRQGILEEIRSGAVQLVIGTHALIEAPVRFRDLGLAVIDEQHRFGVLQRSRLMGKGDQPDVLIMTATPIPRSLALTAYGDLDLSVLDELPPGRRPVETVLYSERDRDRVYGLLRRELAQGRQAYVVYPLIEESEKLELRAAEEMAGQLREVFPGYGLGVIHGRLKSDEKDAQMQSLRDGTIQILVATTVVEVGLDVPNATVMVVEHADRFGLSQLHQLRGRIGRGGHRGTCVLMTGGARSENAFRRLDIMCRTSDGFRIAEKDLEIRGPGEFVGTRQSGIPQFRFGNIVRDRRLLELAAREARDHFSFLTEDAKGEGKDQLARLADQWRSRFGLFDVG